MNIFKQSFRQYFTGLTLLHGFLVASQIIIGSILYFLVPQKNEIGLFEYIIPVVVLTALMGSIFISKRIQDTAKTYSSLKDKLKAYRSALFVKWSLIKAPALITLTVFFMTGAPIFLVMTGAMTALFASSSPSIERMIQDLDLNQHHQAIVRNLDDNLLHILTHFL